MNKMNLNMKQLVYNENMDKDFKGKRYFMSLENYTYKIYVRRHILQRVKEYGVNLFLMDRNRKYLESENNMNEILEVVE